MPAANSTGVLRRAAIRATLATSIMNSQPWRIELFPDRIDLLVDRRRHLPVLDPRGRQMSLSLGAALFNARVVAAAAGVPVEVLRVPDPARSDLFARLRLADGVGDDQIGAFDTHIEGARPTQVGLRHAPVSTEVVARLVAAARAEGGDLRLCEGREREAVAVVAWHAEQQVEANAAAIAEMRAWLSSDENRLDGVRRVASMLSVPEESATDEPGVRRAAASECIAVLTGPSDDIAGWVRSGEALQRVLLELATAGLGFGLLSIPIELPDARREISEALGLGQSAQLIIRIGAGGDAPPLRRRRLVDVLTDRSEVGRPG